MQLSDVPLLSADVIQERVDELGARISQDYAGMDLVLVAVLKGGVVFATDLMRRITVPMSLAFVRAKSYIGTESSGEVAFSVLPDESLSGKHVLIVEDILDTGRTTSATIERLRQEAPASIALCTLLDKPVRREFEIEAAYVGFQIEDQFVVGYGLDYEERYRELPAVHVMTE
jgi:hypoxanthine phosphoribosyltransferase